MIVELCKTMFDMCFYFTFTGYFFYLFTLEYPAVWGIPVIMIAAVIHACLKKIGFDAAIQRPSGKKPVYFRTVLCCALPCAVFAFKLSLPQIIQFLPAWAYFCYTIWADLSHLDRSDFERHFTYSGRLLFLMAFGIIGFNRMIGAFTGALPYFILYLLTGICLMRILREYGKLGATRNVVTVLIILLGGSALVFLRTPQMVLVALRFFYQYVILNVLMGAVYVFGAVFYGIVWVFQKIFFFVSVEEKEFQMDIGPMAEEIFGEEFAEKLLSPPAWMRYAGYTLLALAVLLVLFLILRGLLGKRRREEEESPFSEEHDGLEKHEKNKKVGIFRPKESRQIVRWYYKKYLKEAVSRGMTFPIASTSLRVLNRSRIFFPQGDHGRMRDLYIAARYHHRGKVTEADAHEASELWKKLKHKQPD